MMGHGLDMLIYGFQFLLRMFPLSRILVMRSHEEPGHASGLAAQMIGNQIPVTYDFAPCQSAPLFQDNVIMGDYITGEDGLLHLNGAVADDHRVFDVGGVDVSSTLQGTLSGCIDSLLHLHVPGHLRRPQ